MMGWDVSVDVDEKLKWVGFSKMIDLINNKSCYRLMSQCMYAHLTYVGIRLQISLVTFLFFYEITNINYEYSYMCNSA